MAKIREGDIVKVISGNYKGKNGKVLSFKGHDRVVVNGINVRKKTVKKQNAEDAGFMEIFAPIHISNIQVVISKDDNEFAVKLKTRFSDDGRKELYYKVNGNSFVHRVISTKSK